MNRYSLRQGAHCPVDNGFAPTETECRLAEAFLNLSDFSIKNHRKMSTNQRERLRNFRLQPSIYAVGRFISYERIRYIRSR